MTDIVAIETAKAREQAEKFVGWDGLNIAEAIATALLEAKADILEELRRNRNEIPPSDEEQLLRQEVTCRRLRGM